MTLELAPAPVEAAEMPLCVYLFGSVDFEAALTLQRHLVYQVASGRSGPALLLCEHPPLITVGRHGSPAHLRCDPEELRARRWRVRWVNRGGGCLLHLPGQLAIYPIIPLDRYRLGVASYLERLHRIVLALLDDFNIPGSTRPGQVGVWVGKRPIAAVGVAIRNWVAYFGMVLNVHPDLLPFQLVQTGAADDEPMTSLVHERHGGLRPALVRQRLLEHFTATFPCERTDVFFHHPLLGIKGERLERERMRVE
jgi:lipoyl(octanoyl) transferase